MNRLVRIASLGRSLGMYLIACTQNPMGQVSADMKANMSVSICLRVRMLAIMRAALAMVVPPTSVRQCPVRRSATIRTGDGIPL